MTNETNELLAPSGFAAKAKDCAVNLVWNELKEADGYFLSFYRASKPLKCIKTRRSDVTPKTVDGLLNGVEYLVDVCAYKLVNGKEVFGAKSEKLSFTPISYVLKAQQCICMRSGEQKKIKWEYKNTIPKATFSSSDNSVARIDADGTITAVSAGEAVITTDIGDAAVTTTVKIDRTLYEHRDRAVLMLTGDLICSVQHQLMAKERCFDFTDTFTAVKRIFQEADFTVGVLETTCSDSSPFECEEPLTEKGTANCNSPSTFVSAIKAAGFNALVTANNHNCDAGLNGLNETINAIRCAGIRNIGTIDENPVYVTISDIKIAFIAACMVSNGTEKELTDIGVTKEMLGRFSVGFFKRLAVRAKKAGAHYIVAYQHWGNLNSSQICKEQLAAAQEIADCGADLIIGSHPHVIQKFDVLTASDGRKVPCAFSVGSFLTSMAELRGSRESVIIRAEIYRKGAAFNADISYIPVYSSESDNGIVVKPLIVPVNEEQKRAKEHTKAAIGEKIKPYAAKPKVILSGSTVLGDIFKSCEEYDVSRDALVLSQLTLTGTPIDSVSKNDSIRLKLDIEKSFDRYLYSKRADFVVVDFYAAASLSCYKLGGNYYTASQSFKASAFFKKHEKEFRRIIQPIDENVWKTAISEYARTLTSNFPSSRIILVKLCFSDITVRSGELRNRRAFNALNKRMRDMESFFTELVNPIVIDVSGHYFADADGASASRFEPFFYEHTRKILREVILRRSRKTFFGEPDPEIRMKRILRYYDNASVRAYFYKLCGTKTAADLLTHCTSREFVAENVEYLTTLASYPEAELSSVSRIFKGQEGAAELIAASEAISAVINGVYSKPYNVYSIIFKRNFSIKKQLAALLAKAPELEGHTITPENAEMVLLLRDKPEKLAEYFDLFSLTDVDIWGSCVSRETLNRCPSLHVKHYIFKQPQVLAFEHRIKCEIPNDLASFGGSKWRMKTIKEAFEHSGVQTLADNGKWLIVDFYDLICRMALFEGRLFGTNNFIERTDFYRSIKQQCTPTYLFEAKSRKSCSDAIKRFAEFVTEKYGANIVLVKADLKTQYIGLDDALYNMPEDSNIAEKKESIAYFEKKFAKLTGCYVIDISKYFYSSDSFPHGGAHIVHYEEEFYKEAGAIIEDIIISGNENKLYETADAKYIFMRDLKLDLSDVKCASELTVED